MHNPIILIVFGIVVGVFSGVMGLGGGTVMIPVMVLAFQMTQQQAHGTSLAVLTLPVVLPAVIEYHRHGNVNVKMAAWMALGVVLGSYFGARIANSLPKDTLKLLFGFLLIYVAGYTIFGKENVARSVILATVLIVVAAALFAGTRAYDRSAAAQTQTAAVESPR